MAAVLAGLFGALNSVGGSLGGAIADRRGLRHVVTIGATMMVIGSLALLGQTMSPIWLVGRHVIVAGIRRGMIGVSLTVAHTRTFFGAVLGRITGMLDVGFSIGAAFGIWITLIARDWFGSYVPSLISAAIVCVALALVIVAGAAGTPLRRKHP